MTFPLVTFLILNPTCKYKEMPKVRSRRLVKGNLWQYKESSQAELFTGSKLKEDNDSQRKMTHRWDHVFTISTSLEISSRNRDFAISIKPNERKEIEKEKNLINCLLTAITFTSDVFPAF